MFRLAARAVRPAARGFATSAAAGENEFVAKRTAIRAHAAETTDLWRKISFYVCIPGIIVGGLWTYKIEAAHAEHLAHSDEDLSQRPVYPYMNMRAKPFPWGMQSLFYNPKVNIPAGPPE
ncbi:hypothetical protein CNBC1700 [Cryptococcus deneoformans B-3501A]|uniref:Cytochrome c oxidase subunit 13, mitochondrial n=1 Tax=Cryptococcus deneoformans (strain JEC21 / ATCC MYA-565) TaxID=214684 RepID=Q5KJT0_CRYD1|nr:X15341 cytochrome C oxidase subunit, putative [Cryptococcus neoformans var. neoformans JEC21]XP_776679.1 hypothetical protein CNBC1700 [Cryptococcus neoformans var. neoformans B-3501A]AAW42443.1 X15341 cytochrome C oxidase subunit, putative [Cryptococcus neoformans var. neoformans JEC21]EAL22032.1 hypothetical protein CNBC1700 [Cryptococcus neoformans var. neoformans B-3501A]